MDCKNCNATLASKSDYCNMCGGRVVKNRLTIKNLFQHISERFFNYDNQLLRTCIDLIKKPEFVIDSYVNGVRKKYINPISFFALSLTISGLSLFFIKKFYMPYLHYSNLYGDKILKNPAQDPTSSVLEYNSLISSVLIPFFAFISFFIFFKKKYNFTEHIVIYLYSMSLFSIASIITGHLILFIHPKMYMLFGVFSYLIVFIYHCYLLKRLFMLSIKGLILRSFIFLIMLSVFFLAFSLLTFFAIN